MDNPRPAKSKPDEVMSTQTNSFSKLQHATKMQKNYNQEIRADFQLFDNVQQKSEAQVPDSSYKGLLNDL